MELVHRLLGHHWEWVLGLVMGHQASQSVQEGCQDHHRLLVRVDLASLEVWEWDCEDQLDQHLRQESRRHLGLVLVHRACEALASVDEARVLALQAQQ